MNALAPETLVSRLRHWRLWVYAALALLLGVLVVQAAHKVMAEVSYAAIVAAVRTTPWTALLLSALATALSYLALTYYDRSALAYAGARLPQRVVAKTAFIAYALSNTIGLGVLTGGAVRMRLYGAAGLEAGLISRAIVFNAFGFTLGLVVVGAAALVWGAGTVQAVFGMPPGLLRGLAVVVLLAAGAFIGFCRFGGVQPVFRGVSIRLPSASLASQQLLISAIDVVAAAAALWVLLPSGAIAFPAFVGFFALAIALGVISHVPGGLGVFEAVMLLALGQHVPAEQLAGALVMYRVVYHLLPLALAVLMLAGSEWQRGAATPVVRAASALSPLLLSAFTWVVGVVLLVSGVTPATDDATELLSRFMPLPVVEAAHFLGSIAGLALLFVARGMFLRLDAAWWAGLALALVSLVLCLPKGIAVSEALLLLVLAGALALSHKQFNRRGVVFSGLHLGLARGGGGGGGGGHGAAVLCLPRRGLREPGVVAVRVRRPRAAFAARAGGRVPDHAGGRPGPAVAPAQGRHGASRCGRAPAGCPHRACAASGRRRARDDGRQEPDGVGIAAQLHHVWAARAHVGGAVRPGGTGGGMAGTGVAFRGTGA
ncbi:lysylphosphatidylglycerol synthase domain-containing protein [Hydrogenophaga sp.]|uniref:lysylphosphatidylglycerol synthase domain-containing protein n=1 Tax=Hydrogenophaga sp. TaxID=1904254 RepID=UPI003F6F1DF3